jgi:tryptophan halogenase
MNPPEKNTFIVVGAGTAGAIAATYLKSYWDENIDVILIFDHKKKTIGVGESLTPSIYDFLNYVGITREELIKNVNATVKLGIKFKNWTGDDSYFYHPFYDHNFTSQQNSYNFSAVFDLVNDTYDHDLCYGKEYFEKCVVPLDPTATQSLHIDATLFCQYLLDKFKDKIKIIDAEVVETIVNEKNEIAHLILDNGSHINGDFFIDATGFSCNLFKNLKNSWIDKSDWLPLNKFIPNPVPWEFDKIPVCTTAESTDQGWILQVPLSNRWGTGYLYCDHFISDDEACNNFSKFLNKNFNVELSQARFLKFKSGYWNEQWCGNCMVIGLSSGFAEPLEATNIHQAIYQIRLFTDIYNFVSYDFDRNNYNKIMKEFYDRVYLFIRFCYTGNKNNSQFWTYMNNHVPYEIKILEEKIMTDFLNSSSMTQSIFNFDNFTKIAIGLKKIDTDTYRDILIKRKVMDLSDQNSKQITQIKNKNFQNSLDHSKLIKQIKNAR